MCESASIVNYVHIFLSSSPTFVFTNLKCLVWCCKKGNTEEILCSHFLNKYHVYLAASSDVETV